MSSFLSKLRVVTLGTVNDLLDKAIDLNSPSALRQYTRDLEDALDRMKTEGAIQAGQLRTLEREKSELESRIETTKQTAKVLVANGHEDLARPKAADVLRMQKEVEAKTKSIEAQRVTSANIDKAVAQLDFKHSQILANVHDLERIDRDTKAKEQAAGAMKAAGRLIGGGADVSIDDISSHMKARNDVATEKFNRAMGDVHIEEDPQEAVDVDNFLEGLKETTHKGLYKTGQGGTSQHRLLKYGNKDHFNSRHNL